MGLSPLNVNSETAKAFLAGALLPTIAYFFLGRRRRRSRKADRSNDDGNDDDDSSSSDLFEPVDTTTSAAAASSEACSNWGIRHAPYKMVLVVNTSLGMGKGKIAAQCGHAAVGCYKSARKKCPAGLTAWERTGCAKIAVKCPNEEELELIAVQAMSKDIPFYLVEDAGRTQIAAGSRTVVGLFGPVSVFEGVTDHLKLM